MKAAAFFNYRYAFPLAAVLLAIVFMLNPDIAPAHLDEIEGGGLGAVGAALAVLSTFLLGGAAFATSAHSEVVAERLGQPFGTLVLTLSVTVIEVSVISSMMLHNESNPTLAREAVFSVMMIVNTGLVGLCLLLGSLRYREQTVSQQGIAGYLSVMIALGVLLLILPGEMKDTHDGAFSTFHLIFMSLTAVALYGAFLYMQTVRHKDLFVIGAGHGPHGGHGADAAHGAHGVHAPPDGRRFAAALGMLVVSLVGVVALSKQMAAGFEDGLSRFALADPDAVTGALLAAAVLMPESIAAVSAARRNDLQTSLNLSLGSVLATIALTIPTMAIISVIIDRPMVLGLGAVDRSLLLLTFVLSILSFGTGKTNALNGIVHLIVFFVYVMLLFVP